MPQVNQGESREDYLKRCIPYVKNEEPNLSDDAAVGKCEDLYNEAQKKGQSFARFPSMNACTLEMSKLGHLAEHCKTICNGIFERAMKGALLKALPMALQVMTKANSEDIVLGGYASWEIVDDEGDLYTVEAQSKALQRFLSQAPEYQLITLNHGLSPVSEFKIAQPILNYTDSKGTEYFTHVNEKGTYLLCKLRDDNMRVTQFYRQKALNGELNGYSVSAFPLERKGKVVNDMEYGCITITEKGVAKPINPMTRNVETLSKKATLNTQKSLSVKEMIEETLTEHGFGECNSTK